MPTSFVIFYEFNEVIKHKIAANKNSFQQSIKNDDVKLSFGMTVR